ncbi:hypothetical protein, partial [Stenotrophomonas maltophilia]|uniref:hypothetical protein n=1 Tax=Stenotrophomonas maltophilia TaxID=40324 RepID=UPI0019534E53
LGATAWRLLSVDPEPGARRTILVLPGLVPGIHELIYSWKSSHHHRAAKRDRSHGAPGNAAPGMAFAPPSMPVEGSPDRH